MSKTKRSNNKRRKLDSPVENAQFRGEDPAGGDEKDNVDVNAAAAQLPENGSLNGKSMSSRVTETLRTFNKYYLHFVQVPSFPHFVQNLND